jgi:hypothetical protein
MDRSEEANRHGGAFRFGGTPYEVAECGLRLFAKKVLPVLKSQSFASSARAAAE